MFDKNFVWIGNTRKPNVTLWIFINSKSNVDVIIGLEQFIVNFGSLAE